MNIVIVRGGGCSGSVVACRWCSLQLSAVVHMQLHHPERGKKPNAD